MNLYKISSPEEGTGKYSTVGHIVPKTGQLIIQKILYFNGKMLTKFPLYMRKGKQHG